jgi:hypothetical protein
MINLPFAHPFENHKLAVPYNKDNLFVLAALNRGTRLFEESGFACSLPPRAERPYHLRMSQIGECARKQWYYISVPSKMEESEFEAADVVAGIRALNLGNIIEEYTTTILRLGGLTVTDEQKEVKDLNGAITGHIDGVLTINMMKFLLELKALNLNSASKIVKNGVREGDPVYYSQMQYYMHCLVLSAGYFIAFIKDTGQYYVELVDADPNYQKMLRQRAVVIKNTTSAELIPEKHVVRECNFCPGKQFCVELDGGEAEFIKKFRQYHQI